MLSGHSRQGAALGKGLEGRKDGPETRQDKEATAMSNIAIDTAKGKSAQTFMSRMSILTDIFTGDADLSSLPPFTTYLSMPEGYKAPGGASQNYKSMGRFSRYVYELITLGPELDTYRQYTLNYFAEEQRVGQMITEQGCSAPHDGMHIARALLARLASIIYADIEVEIASREWLAGFLAMCKACSDHRGHVCWPGFRIKKAPESQVRDIVYRCAMGIKQQLPKGDKINRDRFFLGGRLALLLSELAGGIPEPSESLPKLWAPVTVYHYQNNGYLAVIKQPSDLDSKGIKEAVDWVASIDGEMSYGRSYEIPLPPLGKAISVEYSKRDSSPKEV